ncbi:Ribosomal protein S18 acetylase RimI [Chitinophaga eiseniae]|uniref:Ribosomal protein S18 acetylase RimI n=1 Tax=Chitinophaga eiseniae TaxID=634771 RepID=A0A1T4MBP1_9BACT|nr:GNAT family N-acetyltransferase [Chitinophaga eiseniae]SJZ64124.1 Ribosomal protein S18 acetylase RimI [Chitinophaga eiseniae]
MNTELIVAELKDVDLLHQVCTTAYTKHFADHWEPGRLGWYLDQSFSTDRLKKDIEDPGTTYYLIYNAGQPAGFVKLNDRLKDDASGRFSEALELERIYMLPAFTGTGVGKAAMNKIEEIARQRQRPLIVLYVVDANETAIRFYERNGFEKVGKTRLELSGFKEAFKPATMMAKKLN